MPGWQTSCFASLLAVVLTLIQKFNPYPGTELPEADQLSLEYDFVIVGAGGAGNVLANRLTEKQKWRVLLLEAGGRESEQSQIPLILDTLADSEVDWSSRTAPPIGDQRYCLAMTDHICKWSRGKVIGGSTVLNSMLYVRGNRRNYDHWESLGNVGWGYDHVLKYFLKSENMSSPELLQSPYHTAEGHLSVQIEPFESPISKIFIEGGKSLGYQDRDINGKNQSGFISPQLTERHGSRCSTTRAFILPVHTRPNLSILLHSLATKINFDFSSSGPRAKSLSFVKGDRTYRVKARKEIILSAGTIGSPQVLMLSGIGPKEHLEEHGIRLVKNLNVGHNLQNHISTILTFKTGKPVTLKPSDSMNPDALVEFYLQGKGPLTSPGTDAIAFLNSEVANQPESIPDIDFTLRSQSIFNSPEKHIGQHIHNLRPDLFAGTGYEQIRNLSLFDIVVEFLQVKSRGTVKLQSSNPTHQPIINPNIYTVREDVVGLIAGLKKALELVETPPFKAVNATPLEIPFPGCEKEKIYSDTYLECLMRHFTRIVHHPVGTCAMGVTSEAVVDPRLRVHGVRGLRVIDASIMPIITTGNTMTPTIMIAEKGADMIKEDWSAQKYEDRYSIAPTVVENKT